MILNKKNTRTQNSFFNFTTSLLGQFLRSLIQFIVRVVFIQTLGKSFLGINGLFSNILTMLSLTDFGVGTAILFKLYEPIAREDHQRIASLMRLYKIVYTLIGMVIAVIGLCLIPFLPNLIKDYDQFSRLNLNAAFIFILYLFRTVSTYLFFAYKSAIILANQQEYLINLVYYLFSIGGGILQIVFLLVHPKFEIYVLISIIQIVLQNIAIAAIADRMYPYINDKTTQKIGKNEIVDMFKDCGALTIYKLNDVVLKATDNIVLSSYMGLEAVALYSNYYVLYTTINALFSKILGSVAHSLGDLHTTHNLKHEYEIFEVVNLITAILGGTAFAGIFVTADEFVRSWIGAGWTIPQPFAFIMGFELYTLAVKVSLSRYRHSLGLFQQAKWIPIFGMIINLVVSILLVKRIGICGVLLGTLVADWTTFMWFDPLIIHRIGFKNYKPVRNYYIKFALYIVLTFLVCGIDYFLCSHLVPGHG